MTFPIFGKEINVALDVRNHILAIICFLKAIHKFLTEAYLNLHFHKQEDTAKESEMFT